MHLTGRHLADGVDDLLGRRMLGQVATRAELQTTQRVLPLGVGRQHQHRQQQKVGAQLLEHVQAVPAVHRDVEQHHVDAPRLFMRGADLRKCGDGTIGFGGDLDVARVAEQQLELFAHSR